MKNALALVAVGIALIAMLLSWSAGSRGVTPAVAEPDLAPLVARIEHLERALAAVQSRAESPVLEVPVRIEAGGARDESEQDGMTKRVEGLEARLAALEPKKLTPEETRIRLEQRAKERGQLVENAIHQARQGENTEEERLAGLRMLRGQTLADGTDARLSVLDEMILLAQTSTNASTREEVWRQLHHVTDQRLKGPLIDSLALDKDEKVRAKAADTLDDFMPDRQVEVALRSAFTNDLSEEVRKVAARSLAGGR